MLLSLFVVSFWIQLISGWDYKAVTKHPITPVIYNCPVPLNELKRPLTLRFYYPDKYITPLIGALRNNVNVEEAAHSMFSKVSILYSKYSNIAKHKSTDYEHTEKFKSYVDPPKTPDELYKYVFRYSSTFLEEYYREKLNPFGFRYAGDDVKVRVDVAERLPFVRTKNFCTGFNFFACWAKREHFWYEGELQYYLQEWFKNDAFIIVATDKVYFSWLQFVRKMQIKAGVVLRMSNIADRPVTHIIKAIEGLSCHWNKKKHDGQNTIYYSLSMEYLLSQNDHNIAKKSPSIPYIILTLQSHHAQESLAMAKKFFVDETIAELAGFFASTFKNFKLDVVIVKPSLQHYKLFEIYDTLAGVNNFAIMFTELRKYFDTVVKSTGKHPNTFDLGAKTINEIIKDRTKLSGSYVVAPVVVAFSEIPHLFKDPETDFYEKKYLVSFIRELKQQGAHALFINSETPHHQRKMPIKDTDVDVSVIPTTLHPLHVIYDMFLVTRDHVMDRITQAMRLDKEQFSFDTEFSEILPEFKLREASVDVVVMLPTKSMSKDNILSKEYLTESGMLATYEFLKLSLRPRLLQIGDMNFNSYLKEETVVDCGDVEMRFPRQSSTGQKPQQNLEVGQIPIKHINFENCLNKFIWSSGSYKVAVIFVDALTKDWVDAATAVTTAFTTQGPRKEGMIIFVSAYIPAELQEFREKDVYTIDSAVCSDIKQCVLDRIYYSKLFNEQ